MGESVSFLSKNGWEWVAFVEKWVGMGLFFLKNVWEQVIFVENGWEWVKAVGSR